MGTTGHSTFRRYDIKDKLRIVIFGPYDPPEAKQKLIRLKQCLIKKGYTKCKIVTDFDMPVRRDGEGRNAYIVRKSYYWLEHCDVRIFLFIEDAYNEGVTMELKHMLDNLPDKIKHSVVCIENGKTSALIKGEIDLKQDLLRADFIDEDELKGKIIGALVNFSKQLYYEVIDRK